MLPVYPSGIARPTAIISRAPAPVVGPTPAPQPVAVVTRLGVATAPAPAPVYALPQPKVPVFNPSPVTAPPLVPTPPPPAPTAPVSAISGTPIQTSIFQSTHTPSTVAMQVDTEYQSPTNSNLPMAQVSAPAAIGTETVAPPIPSDGTFFGIDQNSFWIILLLAVAVIILVTL